MSKTIASAYIRSIYRRTTQQASKLWKGRDFNPTGVGENRRLHFRRAHNISSSTIRKGSNAYNQQIEQLMTPEARAANSTQGLKKLFQDKSKSLKKLKRWKTRCECGRLGTRQEKPKRDEGRGIDTDKCF